jgi:hypothetical protein
MHFNPTPGLGLDRFLDALHGGMRRVFHLEPIRPSAGYFGFKPAVDSVARASGAGQGDDPMAFSRTKAPVVSAQGLRPFDQNLDPSEHSLISDPRRDVAVMFDVAVEFDALVTHSLGPQPFGVGQFKGGLCVAHLAHQ